MTDVTAVSAAAVSIVFAVVRLAQFRMALRLIEKLITDDQAARREVSLQIAVGITNTHSRRPDLAVPEAKAE